MKNIRQRMLEDMKLRGLAPGTQATYLEAIKVLARHYNRRPDEITQEQVRDFLLYLIESKGYAKSTYKVYLYAIKFLYEKTLGRHQQEAYGLLIKSAADSVIKLAADPHYVGGQVGVMAVLHTWGSNLSYHPHVHCLVTGGGLSPDGQAWMPARPCSG